MFGGFNPKEDSLTSLDLRTPPAPEKPKPPAVRAAPEAKVEAKAAAPTMCVAQVATLEQMYSQFSGAQRKFEEMVRTSLKPQVMFYIVFPQPGLTHSLTTNDGLKTIVPMFNAKPMAEAYIAAKKFGAVPAVCKVENLPQQAEQWAASGINSYALNVCCRCVAMGICPIGDLQQEDLFLSKWRLDLANRRQFAESYGQNASKAIGTNGKQARIWLEGLRDHVDGANPYLHWIIAVLAGIDGDMEANAASIKRLEAFGPPFVGKLQGNSFDLEPGSQLRTMPEAMLGLGVSLGYLDPTKVAQANKPANESQQQIPFGDDRQKSKGADGASSS